MPVYMIQGAYTPESLKTLAERPENRGEAVASQVEKLGGRLIGFYHCFGRDYDVVIICELPDETSAQALAWSLRAAGHSRAQTTTRLLGVNEAMEVLRKAGSAPYQKPGLRR